MCGVPMHLSCMCTESYDSYDGVQSGYSIRCHWKLDIVDTFTHHFCAIRHGGVIGTSFTYIREVEYTGVLQTLNSLHSICLTLLPQSTQPTKVRPDVLYAPLYAAQQVMGPATRSRRCCSLRAD